MKIPSIGYSFKQDMHLSIFAFFSMKMFSKNIFRQPTKDLVYN